MVENHKQLTKKPPRERKRSRTFTALVALETLLHLEETGILKNCKSNLMLYKTLRFIRNHPGLTTYEIAQGLGVSPKTAHRYLRKLREDGMVIIRLGKTKNTHKYYLNELTSNSASDYDSSNYNWEGKNRKEVTEEEIKEN